MPYFITRGTLEDVPGMIDVWYHSFNTPGVLGLFPDTPVVREWLSRCFIAQMSDPSGNIIHMIATEPSTTGGRPRPLSLSIYRKQAGGPFNVDWHSRWSPEIVEGMSEDILGQGFFDPMMRQHVVAMGERPHYFLEILCTHEEFQKLGLGSMLLKWGCDAADSEGLEMYLDAGKSARPLYEKHGYVGQEYHDPKAPATPMRRPGSDRKLIGKDIID